VDSCALQQQIEEKKKLVTVETIEQQEQKLQDHRAHDPPKDLVQDHVLLALTLHLLFLLVHVSISCGWDALILPSPRAKRGAAGNHQSHTF